MLSAQHGVLIARAPARGNPGLGLGAARWHTAVMKYLLAILAAGYVGVAVAAGEALPGLRKLMDTQIGRAHV